MSIARHPMVMFMPSSDMSDAHLHERYVSIIRSQSFIQKRQMVPQQFRDPKRSDNMPCILVYCIIWSDGWDPNRSNKGNRSPVWTATGTFVFVHLAESDLVYLVQTELLACGPGKSSHDVFFDSIHQKTKSTIGRTERVIWYQWFVPPSTTERL